MEKFFTCEEVAARYSIRTYTVWEWIRRGILPAVRIGKLYRIREKDLAAFERSRQTIPVEGGQDDGRSV